MVAFVIAFLVTLVLILYGGACFQAGQAVARRTIPALPTPPPPGCSHVEARYSRWIWKKPEQGFAARITWELYCVDCGEEFVIPLPVSTSSPKLSKKLGGPGMTAVRLALQAKGWKYDEASDLYQNIGY